MQNRKVDKCCLILTLATSSPPIEVPQVPNVYPLLQCPRLALHQKWAGSTKCLRCGLIWGRLAWLRDDLFCGFPNLAPLLISRLIIGEYFHQTN